MCQTFGPLNDHKTFGARHTKFCKLLISKKSILMRNDKLCANFEQKCTKIQKIVQKFKAKLSKLRRELTEIGSGGGKGAKGGGSSERGFEVSKSGDTRVGLVGFPSVGKSSLLTKLTGTFSLAAGYEFTTLTAIPGTMHYRGAKIQVLDLPGIIEGANDGKGRGRQVLAAALTCNVILIVLISPIVEPCSKFVTRPVKLIFLLAAPLSGNNSKAAVAPSPVTKAASMNVAVS